MAKKRKLIETTIIRDTEGLIGCELMVNHETSPEEREVVLRKLMQSVLTVAEQWGVSERIHCGWNPTLED